MPSVGSLAVTFGGLHCGRHTVTSGMGAGATCSDGREPGFPGLYRFLYNSDMETMSYTNARADLARTMDRVNDDRAPIVITRQKGRSAVLMSLEDYNALTETMHLLRSPTNAARLAESIAQADKGRTRKRALIR